MVAQSRQSRLQLPDRHDWIIGPPKDLCPCRALVHEAPIAVQRGHMQRLLWPKPCLTRCIQSSTSLFGVCKTLPSSCTMASELHLVSHLDLLTQCSLQWCLNEQGLWLDRMTGRGLADLRQLPAQLPAAWNVRALQPAAPPAHPGQIVLQSHHLMLMFWALPSSSGGFWWSLLSCTLSGPPSW